MSVCTASYSIGFKEKKLKYQHKIYEPLVTSGFMYRAYMKVLQQEEKTQMKVIWITQYVIFK